MFLFSKSSNLELMDKLNKLVKGQEYAKKCLITLINRSYLRFYQKHVLGKPIDTCVKPKNVLLIGDSGTGKTFLVETLAKLVHFPLICLSATELTPSGNNDGTNLKQIKRTILAKAEYLVKHDKRYHSIEGTIDRTVIFIDEIDKLANSFDSTGNWNKHVQSNFLKFFENGEEFDSISFIFAGAFVGLGKQAEVRNTIGFKSELETRIETDWESEIIKYGLIPELVGRMHNIVKFDGLSEQDYYDILENYILADKQQELSHYGIHDFRLLESEKKIFIKKAMKSGQGIRSLIKDIEKLMTEYEYALDFEEDIQEESYSINNKLY